MLPLVPKSSPCALHWEPRSRIVRQLLTESLVLSGVGALLGLALAFAAVFYLAHQGSIAAGAILSLAVSSLIASLLFSTQPNDPATFAAIFVLLAVVAFAAGYIPARRTSRINPIVALRNN